MAIYTGAQFPPRWRDGFFVPLQGSWNSDKPEGYFVAFVQARDRRAAWIEPAAHYEVFASGFRVPGAGRAMVLGKPAGIAVAPDGALLIRAAPLARRHLLARKDAVADAFAGDRRRARPAP